MSEQQEAWDNEDEDQGETAEHPANPATVPQSPPDMVTVRLSMEERLNMSIQMTLLMDEKKAKKEEVLQLNRSCKNLQEQIDAFSICVRTGVKEVKADDQQDLLQQPVGGQAAAAQFSEMADAAAKASPEATAETNAVDALNEMAADAQAAAGVPAPSEGFETSAEELGRQAGRKRKQAA